MKAIVTGITGQDGAYLAKFLIERGYEVYGTYRRSSSVNFWRVEELSIRENARLKLVEFDITDLASALRLVEYVNPHEIYNLAAQSFVGVSFDQPIATAAITGIGPVNLLEAIRISKRPIKYYQASTSEMFGKVQSIPQSESTDFYPRSPYGIAKLYAHWMTVNYRESYGIFAASGILFNHESPLRGLEFVTRKITNFFARRLVSNQSNVLELGNLDAKRDWGYASDYVDGMWRMLQVDKPDTFVLATGRTETVRDFVNLSASAAGFDLKWEGYGLNEVAYDRITGQVIVKINPEFFRPAEVDLLIGNASKAKIELGWESTTTLEQMACMMVEADVQRNSSGKIY